MNPKDVKDLMSEPNIRDPKITMVDMVKQAIGKLGENIKVTRFCRYELGGK
jgi:elongation factor Ts